MIIQEIKLSKSFFFFNEEVVIVTNEKKISIKEKFDQKIIDYLNSKLKDFKIESSDDFTKLKEKLKDFDKDKYKVLEVSLFSSFNKPWRIFNPSASQVPRPINVVLTKDKGIKEFLVFSLNAKNFDTALSANRSVVQYVKNKIKNIEGMKDEQILMIIKEAIDKEYENLDFELRIGIAFDGQETNDKGKQLAFVSKLIDNYGVTYVENPFEESDIKSYKELNDKFKKICLICMNSKINEYSKGLDKGAFNTLVAKFDNISDFNLEVGDFKDRGLNLVVETDVSPDLVVGLNIPLVKLDETKESGDFIKKLDSIYDILLENKKDKIDVK